MSKLYPCVYCTEDGYCKKYSDDEVTSWCVQSPCKDETPSNADRIRSKSDEELAEFLYSIGQNPVTGNTYLNGKFIFFCGAGNGWLDWLRQEAMTDG